MDKGNAAVLHHAANGRGIHLFVESPKRVHVRYEGQMVCAGHEIRQAPDVTGNDRDAIVFHLLPLAATEDAVEAAPAPEGIEPEARLWSMPVTELRDRMFGRTDDGRVSRKIGKRNVYSRARDLRVYVLRRANGVCEACKAKAPFLKPDGYPYLEPHHIRRRSDGGPDHPLSVAGVCPNCHKQAHDGSDANDLKEKLTATVRKIENGLDA